MANMIDANFGIFPQALRLHEHRAKVLASNVANKSTPNYKAQDIDFNSALKDIKDQIDASGKTPNATQTQGSQVNNTLLNHLKFRTAVQPSLDGNTVDLSVESAEIAKNNIDYIAALNFLTNRIKGLMLAIKGH